MALLAAEVPERSLVVQTVYRCKGFSIIPLWITTNQVIGDLKYGFINGVIQNLADYVLVLNIYTIIDDLVDTDVIAGTTRLIYKRSSGRFILLQFGFVITFLT